MYLTRTRPAAYVRTRLGQANHVLITILIGIEGVRTGAVTKHPEFRTSWRPRSLADSAQRSRRFARDAMLSHVVDSLDSYLSSLRDPEFEDAVPLLFAEKKPSVKLRLDAVLKDLNIDAPLAISLAYLAIMWRNRRVHENADNRLEQQHIAALRRGCETVLSDFSGLDVSQLLERFNRSESPRMKEVTSLVKATLDLVQRLDEAVVRRLVPTRVAEKLIREALIQRRRDDSRKAGQHWGESREIRRRKLGRLLMSCGFVEDRQEGRGGMLDEEYLRELSDLSYPEALQRFCLTEPAPSVF